MSFPDANDETFHPNDEIEWMNDETFHSNDEIIITEESGLPLAVPIFFPPNIRLTEPILAQIKAPGCSRELFYPHYLADHPPSTLMIWPVM